MKCVVMLKSKILILIIKIFMLMLTLMRKIFM